MNKRLVEGDPKEAALASMVSDGLLGLHMMQPNNTGKFKKNNKQQVFSVMAALISENLMQKLEAASNFSVQDCLQNAKVKVAQKQDDFQLIYGDYDALKEAHDVLDMQLYIQALERRSSDESKESNDLSPTKVVTMKTKRKASSHPVTPVVKKVRVSKASARAENGAVGRRSTRGARPKVSYAAMAAGRSPKQTDDSQGEDKADKGGGSSDDQSNTRVDHLLTIKTEPPDDISNLPHEAADELPSIDDDSTSQKSVVNEPSSLDGEQAGTEAETDNGLETKVHLVRVKFEIVDDITGNETYEAEIESHDKEDAGNRTDSFTCTKCSFQSKSLQGLKTHMKKHGRSRKSFTCDVCFVQFIHAFALKNHRVCHFNSDGTLKDAAVALCKHKMKQKGLKAADLSEDMLKYLKEYEEKLRQKDSNSDQKEDAEESKGDGSQESEENAGNLSNDLPPEGEEQREIIKDPATIDLGAVSSAKKKYGSFECELCGQILSTESFLKSHIKNKHAEGHPSKQKKTRSYTKKAGSRCTEEKRLECPHCDFVSYRTQTFTQHIKSHSQQELYKCDLCDYTNALKGEVNRHKRNKHKAKTLQCNQCTTKCRNQILLNQHIKQKHSKVYQRICEQCGKELVSYCAYKEHYKRFHAPGADENHVQMVCTKCGKQCRTKTMYELHMQKHHPDEDDPEEQEVADALIVKSQGTDHIDPMCKLCGFRSSRAREVVKHIIRVHAERRHGCDRCSAAFPRAELLDRHIQVFHLGVERCQCAECGRYFRSQQHLKGHTMRMHVAKDHYKCEVCGRGFYNKPSLLQHMELHKPVDERDYPFTCIECDKRFRYKSTYNKHMADHRCVKPYSCLVCNKKFPNASAMEQHLYVHTQVKPWVCHICQKAFKMKKYLDVHMLSHEAQNIVCQHCGRMFLKKEALQRHICHCVVISEDGKLEPRSASSVIIEELVQQEGPGAGSSVYVCSNCGEVFSDMANIPSHVCQSKGVAIETTGEEATGDTQYICMSCGTQFEDESEAHEHLCDMAEGDQETEETIETAESMDTVNILPHLLGDAGTETVVLEQTEEVVAKDISYLVSNIAKVKGHGHVEEIAQPVVSVLQDNNGLLVNSEETENVANDLEMFMSSAGIEETPSQPLQMFLCGACHKMFSSQEDISQHMSEHEQEVMISLPQEEGEVAESGIEGDGTEVGSNQVQHTQHGGTYTEWDNYVN